MTFFPGNEVIREIRRSCFGKVITTDWERAKRCLPGTGITGSVRPMNIPKQKSWLIRIYVRMGILYQAILSLKAMPTLGLKCKTGIQDFFKPLVCRVSPGSLRQMAV